jgi:hypothetical protein
MPVRPFNRAYGPWNKGLLVGQKKPLEPKHVWSIRVRLEIALSKRDLAMFRRAGNIGALICEDWHEVDLGTDIVSPAPGALATKLQLNFSIAL